MSPNTLVALPVIFLPNPKISVPGVFLSFFFFFFPFSLSLSVFLDVFPCIFFNLVTLFKVSNNFLRASLKVSFDSSDCSGGASSTFTLTFSIGGSTSVERALEDTSANGTIAPTPPSSPPSLPPPPVSVLGN